MRLAWTLTAIALVAGLAADLVLDASVPGLTAATGFVGCALIVYASKWLGRAALQRPEVYYAQPEVEEGLGDA